MTHNDGPYVGRRQDDAHRRGLRGQLRLLLARADDTQAACGGLDRRNHDLHVAPLHGAPQPPKLLY